ncbi:hypothetical protein SLA2020_284170 [Shorea laevis]
MDMGQFAGDLISIAPGAVPLVGDQSSVSGGSSGLFSAFESSGFTGSKEVGFLMAPAAEAGTSLVHSSPAKGMLRRGFLKPRPCGGVSRRSPEPVCLSEAGNLLRGVKCLGKSSKCHGTSRRLGLRLRMGSWGLMDTLRLWLMRWRSLHFWESRVGEMRKASSIC